MTEADRFTATYSINDYWILDAISRFSCGNNSDFDPNYTNDLAEFQATYIINRLLDRDKSQIPPEQRLTNRERIACLTRSLRSDSGLPPDLHKNHDMLKLLYKMANLHILSFNRITCTDDPLIDQEAMIAYYLGAQFMSFISSHREAPVTLTPFFKLITSYADFYNFDPLTIGPLMEHIVISSNSFMGDLQFAQAFNYGIYQKVEKVVKIVPNLGKILDNIGYSLEVDNPEPVPYSNKGNFFIHGVIDRLLIDIHSYKQNSPLLNKYHALVQATNDTLLLPP